jgi:hypothetical protein
MPGGYRFREIEAPVYWRLSQVRPHYDWFMLFEEWLKLPIVVAPPVPALCLDTHRLPPELAREAFYALYNDGRQCVYVYYTWFCLLNKLNNNEAVVYVAVVPTPTNAERKRLAPYCQCMRCVLPSWVPPLHNAINDHECFHNAYGIYDMKALGEARRLYDHDTKKQR